MGTMAKKEEKYFWNLTGETFAGLAYGSEVTEYLKDDPRLQGYLDRGAVVTEKPQTVEIAKESELHQLRNTVRKLENKIVGMENADKKIPKSASAAKKRIAELDEFLSEKDKKIKDLSDEVETLKKGVDDPDGLIAKMDEENKQLKSDLEEATKPKDGK